MSFTDLFSIILHKSMYFRADTALGLSIESKPYEGKKRRNNICLIYCFHNICISKWMLSQFWTSSFSIIIIIHQLELGDKVTEKEKEFNSSDTHLLGSRVNTITKFFLRSYLKCFIEIRVCSFKILFLSMQDAWQEIIRALKTFLLGKEINGWVTNKRYVLIVSDINNPKKQR